LISDPGSYIYTPFPEKRREYRSADAHFSPFNIKTIESEQEFNLFNQIKLPPVNTPTINKNSYFQTYLYQGDRKFFSFDIEDYKITFRSSLIEGEGLSQNRKICLSRGYGTILRNTI